MKNEESIPAFARVGSEPPLNAVFSRLRDAWLAGDENRTSQELARLLDDAAGDRLRVVPQHVSQWATGTDRRRPPWWVVVRLAWLVGYRIVIEPDRVRLEPCAVEVRP